MTEIFVSGKSNTVVDMEYAGHDSLSKFCGFVEYGKGC